MNDITAALESHIPDALRRRMLEDAGTLMRMRLERGEDLEALGELGLRELLGL